MENLKGVKVLFCDIIGIFESLVDDFCKCYNVVDIKYFVHEGTHSH